jgi:hypothetical protein
MRAPPKYIIIANNYIKKFAHLFIDSNVHDIDKYYECIKFFYLNNRFFGLKRDLTDLTEYLIKEYIERTT